MRFAHVYREGLPACLTMGGLRGGADTACLSWEHFCVCRHAFDRQTDRQTDGHTLVCLRARTAAGCGSGMTELLTSLSVLAPCLPV
mmetsp:Transcript_33730/g.97278  ORF Transcript_33730/g.97278 Transcript_33730/m.97278 type:complete len:86 (-) Transcript_33730:103-360(-)